MTRGCMYLKRMAGLALRRTFKRHLRTATTIEQSTLRILQLFLGLGLRTLYSEKYYSTSGTSGIDCKIIKKLCKPSFKVLYSRNVAQIRFE